MIDQQPVHVERAVPAAELDPRPARRRGMLARLARRPLAMGAAAFIAIVVLASIAAPLLAPHQPDAQNYETLFSGPGAGHLLGTDDLGRDILSRLIYGGRVSLVGVAEALAIYLLIGMLGGLVSGYVGGWLDSALMWLADLSFSVPQIVVVLAVLAIFGQNMTAAMLSLGVLGGPALMRIVRGATVAVRQEQYIVAAQVSGLSTRQVLTRHVLPRIAGPIIVQTSLFAGVALIFQTGLDFLGLATQPPTASWGSMVAEGAQNIVTDSWMIVPPGCLIALMILAFGLLGDGVRDSYSEGWSTAAAPGRVRRARIVATPHDESLSSPLSDALLSVRDLSVAIDGPDGPVPVVDGVSFDLQRGEAMGIVGESGCGKTMTALALLGLLPDVARVTGGELVFDGRPLHGLSEAGFRELRGSQISIISQEPVMSLDPSFTVGAQLGEVVRQRQGSSRAAARARSLELLDLVNLPDPARVHRSYPFQLSGGMAQRVAIAAALAAGPKLLIADEPTTALDVTVQAEILDLLRSLQAEMGLAVVLISHDWGVVADLCRHAIVMYAGQVVERADVSTMFARPRHPYTAGLLASDPHLVAGGAELPALPGAVPAIGEWPVGCRFAPRCGYATAACSEGPIGAHTLSAAHMTRCIHHDGLPETRGAAARA
ncbi:MAG TPA: dipeptide/oligopeptide/nickel ABC transporter permease/ATP-binding protein [Gaiellales bacterium]